MKSIIIKEVCINIFKHCYYFIVDFQFSLVSWICSFISIKSHQSNEKYIGVLD